MDTRDKYEKALEYDIFTKEEYGFAKQEIKKAECIFDIGGHKGYFSKWCRFLNPTVKIHYFEPIGEFYNQAKINLGNDKNIIFNNYGIAPKSESGTILLNQEKTMQSSKYQSFLNPEGTRIVVNFISLKDYLEGENIDKVDVLKMDIEGMEFEAFGSRSNFEWGIINTLIAEIHLLTDEMVSKWQQVLLKIRDNYQSVEMIESGYRKEIFLILARK